MDHDKLIGAGEHMGLTGSELQEYVEKREKEFLDREECMLRREDEKSGLEFERLKLEEERLEKQASLKREEQEREIELLKLRVVTGFSESEIGSKSLRPKLPKFEEQKDDMDLLCFCLSCDCYVFVRVCLYVLCDHLLGKG